ncbi:MAG TPA: hypothetical protein VK836_05970, partial [Streptosporangiaceae bacterium]|nr:hypothetical protein [Streptosporangiaceae bacterium]
AGPVSNTAAVPGQFSGLFAAVREPVSGAEHPDTLAARTYLAVWTGKAGDAISARDQLQARPGQGASRKSCRRLDSDVQRAAHTPCLVRSAGTCAFHGNVADAAEGLGDQSGDRRTQGAASECVCISWRCPHAHIP